ncbi:hypothetical protein GYMLUDRAFT_874743 [Collybiopsis luxurians FD-317 M1]|nr:hypothetical protein GYMLUDRAFT_874743 [Collybiopsis luxurians FD-317 M1]
MPKTITRVAMLYMILASRGSPSMVPSMDENPPVGFQDDGVYEGSGELAFSPLLRSSPPPEMSPHPESAAVVEGGYDQPSPVYILSDDDEAGENHYHTLPLRKLRHLFDATSFFLVNFSLYLVGERSSPPAEYDQDDGDDESDVHTGVENNDVPAKETILPLGTSDLDVPDQDNMEAERSEVDKEDEIDQLAVETQDAASMHKDSNIPLQKESLAESAELSEAIATNGVTPHPPDSVGNGESLVSLQETNEVEAVDPLPPKPIIAEEVPASLPQVSETTEEPEMASSPVPESSDISLVAASSRAEEPIIAEDPEVALMAKDEDAVTSISHISGAPEPHGESIIPLPSAESEIQEQEDDRDAYNVVEIVSEDEGIESDVDGEFDVESVTAAGSVAYQYEVEEIMTEGRLTVEPELRERSTSFNLVDLPDPTEESINARPEQDITFGTERSATFTAAVTIDTESKPSPNVLPQAPDLTQTLTSLDTDVVPSRLSIPLPGGDSTISLMDVIAPEHMQANTEVEVSADSVLPEVQAAEESAHPSSLQVPFEETLLPQVDYATLEEHPDGNRVVPTAPILIQEDLSLQPTIAAISQVESATPSDLVPPEATSVALSDRSHESVVSALMTRNAIPVLHADPYPASLSTPDVDVDQVEEEQASEDEIDEIEDDSPNSSMEREKSSGNPTWSPLSDDGMDLQYPPSEAENTSSQALNTASEPATASAQELTEQGPEEHSDSDAEGDVDPDFAMGGTPSILGSDDAATEILDEKEGRLEGVISTQSPSSSLPAEELVPSIPAALITEEERKAIKELNGNMQHESDITGQLAESSEVVEVVPNGHLTAAETSVEIVPRVEDTASQSTTETTTVPEAAEPDAEVKPSLPAQEGSQPVNLDSQISASSETKEESEEGVEEPAANTIDSAAKAESPSLFHVAEDSGSPRSPRSPGKKFADGSGTRRSKRKKKTPITMQASSSAVEKETSARKPAAVSKGKGKRKEDVSDSASNSSASAAARMLTGSRASSVVSTSTGDGINQSPTPARNKNSQYAAPPPPPPPPPLPQLMFHNHSRKAAPLRPTLTLQTQLQKTVTRAPSLSQVNVSSPSQQVSPVAGSSDSRAGTPVSGSSPQILRREPSSNSPVTRSHCRYHKISLPEDDDQGSHIFFLVPGCSLVDRKVMKEEEIVDHGDATYDDSIRKVADIETLHINDYVLGVIRLLVGPDKEHEVYFLPKPGEERARKVIHRKSHLGKSSFSSAGYGSHASPNGNLFSPSSSTRGPVSIAGSTSTTRSGKERHRSVSPGFGTDTDGEGSDDDDEDSPEPKRVKLDSPEDPQLSASAPNLPGDSSQTQGSEGISGGPEPRTKTKRKRPLDESAAAYTPGSDGEDSDSAREQSKPKKKKNALKRARTSEVNVPSGSDEGDRKRKKTKTLKMIPYGLPA